MLTLSDGKAVLSQAAPGKDFQRQEHQSLSDSLRVKHPINMDYRISKYDPLESI